MDFDVSPTDKLARNIQYIDRILLFACTFLWKYGVRVTFGLSMSGDFNFSINARAIWSDSLAWSVADDANKVFDELPTRGAMPRRVVAFFLDFFLYVDTQRSNETRLDHLHNSNYGNFETLPSLDCSRLPRLPVKLRRIPLIAFSWELSFENSSFGLLLRRKPNWLRCGIGNFTFCVSSAFRTHDWPLHLNSKYYRF